MGGFLRNIRMPQSSRYSTRRCPRAAWTLLEARPEPRLFWWQRLFGGGEGGVRQLCVRHGGTGKDGTVAFLGARAALTAGRGGRTGYRPVRSGRGAGDGARDVALDGADDGWLTGAGRPVRLAARARLSVPLAARLPPKRLGGGDRAGRYHSGGVAGGGVARPRRDRGLRDRAQRARMDRVVLARAARLNARQVPQEPNDGQSGSGRTGIMNVSAAYFLSREFE